MTSVLRLSLQHTFFFCSKYSDIVVYATAGSPPSQPAPPQLLEQGVDSLRLGWGHRPEDEDYILQMNDPATEYGFLHVYNGKDTQYCCTNLHRYTSYKFRVSIEILYISVHLFSLMANVGKTWKTLESQGIAGGQGIFPFVEETT